MHNQIIRSSNQGYTLIELVVVIGLTSVLLITAVSIFFTTLQGGGKTASSEYVKQSGQHAINQITFLIRNAKKLSPNAAGDLCVSSMNTLDLLNQDGTGTRLGITDGKFSTSTTKFLTPDDIVVEASGAPLFSCSPSVYGTAAWDGSPPTITVSFQMRKGTSGVDKERDIVVIPFQSTITMRNF